MSSKRKLVYIIAGEPSGDFIGSKLINSLKANNNDIEIAGIGGDLMIKAGIKSLFDIKNISIMGIFEILPQIFKILKLIKLTVKDITQKQPDILITIDSPGFNFAIAKAIKKQFGNKIKLVHYVAPSVWAYKEKRAKKVAKLYDYLFCLLPFEPPYFIKEGLTTFFVGHPIVESKIAHIMLEQEAKTSSIFNNTQNLATTKVNNSLIRTATTTSNKPNITTSNSHNNLNELLKDNNRVISNQILLLPGSRAKEVSSLLPIFLEAAKLIKQKYKEVEVTVATIPTVAKLVKELSKGYKVNITTTEDGKYQSFLASKVAIAASGTVTLELALAKVKTVVGYKLNILTSILLALILKVKFVSLINIMAKRAIFPEILGPRCTAKNLSSAALQMWSSRLDSKEINNILQELGYNNFIPSQKAAKLIIQIIKGEL